MFKLARDKYMVALESAEELETTLRKENENLGIISKKLAENWWGIQAEISLKAINKSIEISNHAKALAYTQGMTSIMGEYLPELEKLMAKREQIGQQLKQDGYVEPDLTSFSENELIVNYEYIDDIKADVEGALHYGDTAAEILEEMIEDAEEYGGEYLNLTQVREILKEGKKKLHRLENYKYEFGDFGKKMSDLEYNMSLDLSNVMRVQGDTTFLKNPILVAGIKNVLRIGKIERDDKKRKNQDESAMKVEENEKLTLSDKGYKLLIHIELGTDLRSYDYIELDENGNISKIRNHNVGDGGTTVGIGIFVNESYPERIKMLNDLGIDWQDTTQWVSIDDVEQVFSEISDTYSSPVDNIIEKYNLQLTQEQYDALFLMAYNRLKLFEDGGTIDTLLAEKNNNKEEWRIAILEEYKGLKDWGKYGNGWTNRIDEQLELFFEGDYIRTR